MNQCFYALSDKMRSRIWRHGGGWGAQQFFCLSFHCQLLVSHLPSPSISRQGLEEWSPTHLRRRSGLRPSEGPQIHGTWRDAFQDLEGTDSCRRDRDLLEQVQNKRNCLRAETSLHEDRLRDLGLFILEKRRYQEDLIAAFQHLKRDYRKDGETIFAKACSDRTRVMFWTETGDLNWI